MSSKNKKGQALEIHITEDLRADRKPYVERRLRGEFDEKHCGTFFTEKIRADCQARHYEESGRRVRVRTFREVLDVEPATPMSDKVVCPKCKKKTVPIFLSQTIGQEMEMDSEDPDYDEIGCDWFPSGDSINMGAHACRECYHLIDFFIEDASGVKFEPGYGGGGA